MEFRIDKKELTPTLSYMINNFVDAAASRCMCISPGDDRRSFPQVAHKFDFILFIPLNDLSLEQLMGGSLLTISHFSK